MSRAGLPEPGRGPDARVLDANLHALLKRAYVPVVARAELRRALLALAADEARRYAGQGVRRSPSLPRLVLWAVPLAAAAALFVWPLVMGARLLGGGGDAPDPAGRTPEVALEGNGGGGRGRRAPRSGGGAAPENVGIEGPARELAGNGRRPVGPAAGAATTDGAADPGEGGSSVLDPLDAEAAPAAIAGRVTGPDGAPIRSFRVILLADHEVPEVRMPELRAFDSADGAFRWEGLDADRYEVFVEADGLAQHRQGPLELAAGATLELDVALAPGRRLRGWVVAEDGEAPIPGATVVVESETPSKVLPMDLAARPGWLTRIARTGSDGGFTLADLAPGRGRLRVDAPGYAPAWVNVDVDPVPAGATAADALELSEIPQILVRLGPGGQVGGTVTDAYGRPVGGAVLLATFGDDPARARLFSYTEARTDADGEYAFDRLAPGFYMIVQWPDEAAFQGGAAPTLRPAIVRAGERATVDFRGESAEVTIRGTLRDADGAPLSHHKLTLLPEEANTADDNEDWLGGASDAEGRFEFAVERAGRYLLFATFGMGERLVLVHAFDVPAGEDVHAEDARFAATHAIVDVVRALDHDVVPHATLAVLRIEPDREPSFAGRALSDQAGRAVLRGLPPGRYVAVAEALESPELGQGVSAPFELDPASPARPTHARVELPLGGVLRLVVRDAGGDGVGGARVTASRASGASVHPFLEPVTDAEGRLDLGGLAPDTSRIRVVAAGFAPATADVEVRVVDGADLQLVLEPLD